jgi:hypothetical protein
MNLNYRAFHQYWQTDLIKGKNANLAMAKSYFGQCVVNKPKGLPNKIGCGLKKNLLVVRYPQMASDFFQQLPEYVLNTREAMWNYRHDLVQLFFKRGWFPFAKELMTPDEFNQYVEEQRHDYLHYETNFKRAKQPEWYTESYIQLVTEYCKQKHIPLVFVLMPEPKRFTQFFYKHALGVEPAGLFFKIKLFSQKQKVPIWDLSKSILNEQMYGDIVHLNIPGSLVYSRQIAGLINKNERGILMEKSNKQDAK